MSTSTKKAKAPKGVTPPSGDGRSGFLSDVIVELEFASREAVEQAVRAARSPGTTVARVLVESGAVTEEQLARATAERYGIDYIDLAGFDVDPSAANLIKPTAARRYQAVPVAYLGSGLLVAMADPADALGVNDIAVMTKLEVRPAVASRPALEELLEALPLDEHEYERAEPEAPEEEAPEAPDEEPASSAVFWQENGDASELPAAAAPAASDGDASELRGELEALKAQLAGAEAKLGGEDEPAGEAEELRARLAAAEEELEQARVRVREAKEVSAELESLREKLAGAQAGLDQASARVRDGDVLASEAEELRAKVTGLKQERDELRSELRRVGADAEVRTGELESLRTKVTDAETELVRVRAEVDARGTEVEAMRTRAESAEREAEEALRRASEAEQEGDEARRRAGELEREAGDTRKLAEELEAADTRAENARQAHAELREEHDREREQ
ncbi:MAG: hypothetical protein ACRDLD_15390, partial [Thermoleophilaceae bacterium]